MWRSVGTNDFKMTNNMMSRGPQELRLERKEGLTGPCWVCEKYEMHQDEIVAQFGTGDSDKWRGFDPLKETPDLFLRFSRLHRERNFAQGALSFSRQYGLPCATAREDSDVYAPPTQLSLQRFFEESLRAWVVVSLYESVLNRDEGAARSLLTNYRHLDNGFRLEFELLDEKRPEGKFRHTPLQCALGASVAAVSRIVKRSCEPNLVLQIGDEPQPDPSDVKQIWYFNDLRGAMYLQMYWLLTSGGNLARCEHCKRVISLSRPYPEGRKRRRDRRFCDDACRQAHHRIKEKS